MGGGPAGNGGGTRDRRGGRRAGPLRRRRGRAAGRGPGGCVADFGLRGPRMSTFPLAWGEIPRRGWAPVRHDRAPLLTPVAPSTARGRQSKASCDSVAAAARAPSAPHMQPHPHAWGVAGGFAQPREAQGAAPDVTRDAGSATEPQRVFLANARGPERALRPPPLRGAGSARGSARPAPACRAERPSSGLRNTRPAASCACSSPGASPRSPGMTRHA